jgi:hydroxymethylbilane synthase
LNHNTIIIGTRGSDLALWQANHIKGKLEKNGLLCVLKIISTKGDLFQDISLDKIEGKGFFTKEIEEALLNHTIDLAVHSHKDLETTSPQGLVVAAVSERADPSELLLIKKGSEDHTQVLSLKKGAVIGTSSARRKSQLLHNRPDIVLKDIRGNVPTRVKKLRDGHYDAILLAKAGTDRLQLDLSGITCITIPTDIIVPAPAQGVLAVQCRSADMELREALQVLHHAPTQELIEIERTVLKNMNGGCHLPLGVFASKENEEITVHVAVARQWDEPVRMLTFIGDFPDTLIQIITEEIQS